MSLKEYVTAIYGNSLYKDTSKLQDFKVKYARAKNQLVFLERCLHHSIIPKFLNIRCPVKSNEAKEVTNQYKRRMLVSTKRDTKRRLRHYIYNVNKLEASVREKVSEQDYDSIISAVNKSKEQSFLESKQKLKNKFELLYKSQKPNVIKQNQIVKNAVLNLVNDEIPKHHEDLLNLGPKFVPTSNRIPYMEIITKTEKKALELERSNEHVKAEQLRQSISDILKKAKPPKSNLNKTQKTALKELKSEENIRIYPFDKGSGFVRIKHEDAIKKIEEQIGETKVCTDDPTNSLIRQFQNKLRNLKKEEKLDDKLYRKLYPTDGIPPRMYGLIKAHKPGKNFPMRMVVSTIGSPPYETSKYLVSLINPTLNKNPVRVKNSQSFVKESKEWIISNNEIQVSFDAVNLYPSIPIKKATDVTLEILSRDIDDFKTRTKLNLRDMKMLIDLCLKKCYFLYNNEIRMLDDAGPIGLSLMVVIAEAYLQFIEDNAIKTALSVFPPCSPITYKRYVDDTHSRFENEELSQNFLTILNQQDPQIQFTIEKEDENNTLNFLDITIKNNNTGKYQFKIHRKEAITNVHIKPNSNIDPKIKTGVFKGFLYRAKSICSEETLQEEINFLQKYFHRKWIQRKRSRQYH